MPTNLQYSIRQFSLLLVLFTGMLAFAQAGFSADQLQIGEGGLFSTALDTSETDSQQDSAEPDQALIAAEDSALSHALSVPIPFISLSFSYSEQLLRAIRAPPLAV